MFKLQAAAMGGGSIAAIVLLTICLGIDSFFYLFVDLWIFIASHWIF